MQPHRERPARIDLMAFPVTIRKKQRVIPKSGTWFSGKITRQHNGEDV